MGVTSSSEGGYGTYGEVPPEYAGMADAELAALGGGAGYSTEPFYSGGTDPWMEYYMDLGY